APYRMLIALSVLLTVGAVLLSTLGPRVLGRATDFIFAGYLGNRLGETFPDGTSVDAAAAGLRSQGQDTLAEMIEGTPHLVVGQGVDLGAVGRTVLLVVTLYAGSALLMWISTRLVNRISMWTV